MILSFENLVSNLGRKFAWPFLLSEYLFMICIPRFAFRFVLNDDREEIYGSVTIDFMIRYWLFTSFCSIIHCALKFTLTFSENYFSIHAVTHLLN